MKVYDVLTFGEAMGMFIAEEPGHPASVRHFTKELAGAETNVAIGLSRLGYRVLWLSKVGTDPLGDYIIQELQREKVDTSLIKRDEENLTGFQLKEKVSEGDPGVYYYRKNSAASRMGIKDFPELEEIHAKHYHLTGIPLALSPSVREHREASKSELVFRARPEYKILYSLVNEQNELEIDINFGFKTYYTRSVLEWKVVEKCRKQEEIFASGSNRFHYLQPCLF
ncbi:sugar kinase [Heyndrickxia coagulans]|uniref:sugar kinase n=1 Tax=Heyndrickxia coagulans TaxID=1398 RepID=UPI002ECF69C7|nr:sugar kinase [Heyndrickxia coagulans]